jgi:hypothetical protein
VRFQLHPSAIWKEDIWLIQNIAFFPLKTSCKMFFLQQDFGKTLLLNMELCLSVAFGIHRNSGAVSR